MGAQTSSRNDNKSSRSNDNSTKNLPQPVVDSDVKPISVLILKLSKDVSTSKKIFNEIETSENIGQKIQELQKQFDQIKLDIDHTVKEIKKLQHRIIHAGTTQPGLSEELAELIKSLRRLDAENQHLMTKSEELQKRAQRLPTGAEKETAKTS